MPITQILNIDQFLMRFINIGMANPFFDSMMVFVTHVGSLYLWILIAGAFLIRKKVAGIALTLGLIINSALIFLFKNVFMRARPESIIEGIRVLVTETNASFPSGHTSTAFVGAVVLSHYYPHGKPIFYSLAGLIALSRVYVGVHFPIDVIVGGVVGYLVANAVLKLPLTKYSKRLGFDRNL